QKVAYLEFKLVHPQSAELLSEGRTAPGYETLTQVTTQPDGTKVAQKYLIKRRPEMIGGIERANMVRDTLGRPEILFKLESAAAKTFARITRENVGRQLAIVL